MMTGRLNEAAKAIQPALRGMTTRLKNSPFQNRRANRNSSDRGINMIDAQKTMPRVSGFDGASAVLNAAATDTAVPPTKTAEPGKFSTGSHSYLSQTRRYKLYVPTTNNHMRLPLVVMLHGCTQDADDFAAGTGMNDAAREQGFFVLYPEQSSGANASKCWNWFKSADQQRGAGEPALLATMTQAVVSQHPIDPARVYIAGLSAGGAMAAIVAETYPDIFAAAGVHSGLPCGAARSVIEAFSVMRNGNASRFRTNAKVGVDLPHGVPTIVFHGDQDQTVHPRNGDQVIAAVLDTGGTVAHVQRIISVKGRHYTRSTHRDHEGTAVAEHWLVHGAGHAWSGGSAAGSYTDSAGPDATGEMLRFFFAQSMRPLRTN